MIKFAASAAVVTFAIAFVAPASAEQNYGPRVQNGKCWHAQTNNAQTMFGFWEDCPRAAAVTTGTRSVSLRHPIRARRDQHNDR